MYDGPAQRVDPQALRLDGSVEALLRAIPGIAGISRLHDGLLLVVNDRLAALYGARPAELVGRTVQELRLWVDLAQRAAIVEQVAKYGRVDEVIAVFQSRDGKPFHVLVSMQAVHVDGEAGLLVIGQDITELQHTARIDGELAAIVRASPDAIVVTTPAAVVTSWNGAAERLFGYPAAEIVGRSLGLILPAATHRELDDIRDALLAGTPVLYRETVCQRRDGTTVPVATTHAPILDSADRLIAILTIVRDLSARKHEESTRARLASLVESSHDAILSTDLDGVITGANAAATRLLGFEPAEIVGAPLSLTRPTGRPERWSGLVERIVRGEHIPEYETVRRRRDGSLLTLSVSLSPIRESSGAIVGVSIFARDVSEQKRGDAVRARLAAVVESSSEAIYSTTVDGAITDWNRAAERLYGYAREEMVGGPVDRIVPPERAGEIAHHVDRVLRGEPSVSFETVRLTKAGQRVDVLLTLSPILDADGRIVGISRLGHDVTARKRAEVELLRYADIVDRMPIGLCLWEPADPSARGRFRLAGLNRAAADLIGVGTDAAGLPLDAVFRLAAGEHAAALDAVVRSPGGDHTYEAELDRADGSTGTLVATAFPLPGGLVGWLARDVTEQRRLETQLRQAQKMEAIGQLAGGIAHDFNNLLGVIIGYGELLFAATPPGTAGHAQLREIVRAGERAANLTQQLLAFSRKQVLQTQVLDLNARVTDTLRLLRRLLGEDIAFTTRLSDGLGRIQADPGQIEQVLINMAVNARDAMPAGGKLTLTTANVELRAPLRAGHDEIPAGAYVVLSIADTGCGMDAATRARIFEPFFTTKPAGQGTGLGLSTVYGIVRQSGGHIDVQSEPGRGTCLRIYIPRVDAPAPTASPRATAAYPRGSATVLLVEDEPALRRLAQTVLEQHGYTALAAGDGEQALAIWESYAGTIDLLVTDVVLPGMNGRDLAERLRSRYPATRVLFVSGYTDDAVMRRGVSTGTASFLQKPFTPAILLRHVHGLLAAE